MLKRSSSALKPWVVVIVGALVLGLSAFFILSNISPDSTFAQNEGEMIAIQYAEVTDSAATVSSIAPVRTFRSNDPEGLGVTWDVTGTDADDFTIENGVLRFAMLPNFEKPTDRAHDGNSDGDFDDLGIDDNNDGDFDDPGDTPPVDVVGDDSMYHITVWAIETARSDRQDSNKMWSRTDVVISVENVDEDGEVELNWLQPQQDVPIMATLTDPDSPGGIEAAAIEWTWEHSTVTGPRANVDADWESIAGTDPTGTGNMISYTPLAGDASTATLDRYLRVTATYTDGQGAEKTAIGTSEEPVREDVSPDPSPDFENQVDLGDNERGYKREVSENAGMGDDVGSVVEATDPDDDVLTYQLASMANGTVTVANADAQPDVHFFSINKRSGQIMLAMGLDADGTDGREVTDPVPEAGKYEVYVIATDPSGEDANVQVMITVTPNTNDAPEIMASDGTVAVGEFTINEQNSDDGPDAGTEPDEVFSGEITGAMYRVDDAEGEDITWGLTGPDNDLIKITAANGGSISLEFKTDADGASYGPLNYEDPADADKDNIYNVVLEATDKGGPEGLNRAKKDTRPISIIVEDVPETGKLTFSPAEPTTEGMIEAVVEDPDGERAIITWQWFRLSPDHLGTNGATALALVDHDSDGGTTPEVPNWMPIMGATSAMYQPKAADVGHYLVAQATYIDAASQMDESTTPSYDERVQMEDTGTVTAKTPVSGIAPPAVIADNAVYIVDAVTTTVVRAGDTGPTDPTTTMPPEFTAASYTLEVTENARVGHYVGGPVMAARVDSYDLVSDKFEIDEHGQITVKDSDPAADVVRRPDLDFEDDDTYTLTVTARGENYSSDSTDSDTATVVVNLVDVNERPYIERPVGVEAATLEENSLAPAKVFTVLEPDGDGIRWSVMGTDAAYFEMTNDGRLRFVNPPNYEMPRPARTGETAVAERNVYTVTVVATESSAVGGGPVISDKVVVTVTVTDKDEHPMMELSLVQPEVGTEISMMAGSLMDPDITGDAPTPTWQWYKSRQSGSRPSNPTPASPGSLAGWQALVITENYTPVAADVGRYLLLVATYDDDDETGETEDNDMAVAISHYPVRADVEGLANGSPDFSRPRPRTFTVSENLMVGADVVTTTGTSARVVVSSLESGEYLTYTVEDHADAANADDSAFFSIDQKTGQLRIAQKLDAKEMDGRAFDGGDPPTAGEYKIMVMAQDPSNSLSETSGLAADQQRADSDTVEVVITVVNYNENPNITTATGALELMVNEKDSSSDNDSYTGLTEGIYAVEGDNVADNRYRWEDEDGDAANWSLEGEGGRANNIFQLVVGSPESTEDADEVARGDFVQIKFREAPDYEMPMDQNRDNVYEITLAACETGNRTKCDRRDVRIEVMNIEETGELTLDMDQPTKDDTITAELMDYDRFMTDPEAKQNVVTWTWYWTMDDRSLLNYDGDDGTTDDPMIDGMGDFVVPTGSGLDVTEGNVGLQMQAEGDADPVQVAGMIAGATTAMLDAEDYEDRFLHARVTYRDGANVDDHPPRPYNDDDERDAKEADGVIPARDEDMDRVLVAKTKDAVAPPAGMGPDPDAPNTAPSFAKSMYDRAVPENTPSTGYVGLHPTKSGEDELYAAIMATDMEDMDDTLTYRFGTLGRFTLAPDPGADASEFYFDIVSGDLTANDITEGRFIRNTGPGQIVVNPVTHLDYEDVARRQFVLTLTAIDSGGMEGTTTVTIEVMDVNEPPSAPMEFAAGLVVTGQESPSVYEVIDDQMPAPTVTTYTAVGVDAAMARWTLSGDDMGDFTIDNMSGEVTFRQMPDYETPMDDDMDNMYQITVMANDGSNDASLPVTVAVMNMDEEGRVTFWRDGQDATEAAIMVGDVLTGLAEDPDGDVGAMPPITGENNDMYPNIMDTITWQWSRTMTPAANNWEDITGADMAEYTVDAMDATYYLRATAMYTDAQGSGKDAEMATRGAVDAVVTTPDDDLIAMYDGVANGGNGDGIVQKLEYLAALDDFLDEIIDRDDLLTVLDALIDALS